MSVVSSNSKVVQVCNISTTCQREQFKSLFNFFGRIDEVQLYPDRFVHRTILPFHSLVIVVRLLVKHYHQQ